MIPCRRRPPASCAQNLAIGARAHAPPTRCGCSTYSIWALRGRERWNEASDRGAVRLGRSRTPHRTGASALCTQEKTQVTGDRNSQRQLFSKRSPPLGAGKAQPGVPGCAALMYGLGVLAGSALAAGCGSRNQTRSAGHSHPHPDGPVTSSPGQTSPRNACRHGVMFSPGYRCAVPARVASVQYG